MCDEKWILYNNRQWPAQWLDWEVLKHIPKPNLHQKRSRSLPGGLLPVWSTTAFWILANHYIWEARSANRWEALKVARPAAGTGQQKGPNSSPRRRPTAQPNTSKSWTSWATKFCLICHVHLTSRQLTTTSSSILTTFFAGKMLPQSAGGRKCFPGDHWITKHGFLCYRNKQTYFSLAKMCWL